MNHLFSCERVEVKNGIRATEEAWWWYICILVVADTKCGCHPPRRGVWHQEPEVHLRCGYFLSHWGLSSLQR